ncbi:MAG: outer membrane protein OmpA-like peptidoglycan-associated protein [Cyclobacteriaceae bacterium]|jgi:outer membrane protein OmpA-like peptidoglycan-associated protein/tetratricopeptide (TPR) repeat protein
MNKSLIVTSIFFLFSFFASAQYQVIKSDTDEEVKTKEVKEEEEKVQKERDGIASGDERRGDKHFYNFAYSTALDYYLDALEKDSTQVLKLKVAECYKMLNDFLKADDWYHKGLTEHGAEVDPKYKLHYAQALSTEQRYDEAKEWFEEYQKDVGSDSRSGKKIEGLNDMGRFFKDSVYYNIKQVSINSVGLDFSPMWYDEGILFVSSRTDKPFSKTVFNWDQSSYLDVYYAKSQENGDLESPSIFHKKVNTKYHEGPLSFYNDQKNVVFTRNNYFKGKAKKSSDGITKLKLYFADRKKNDKGDEDDWVNIRPFEYNDDEYSVGHPSITNDGEKMFFSSDMPGGFGGTDIYVTYLKNGEWGQPKNLGKTINTEGMEVFPYLNGDYLYFSSDGHGGLGGLDLYRATLLNDEAVEFKNLGHPMSSSFDDFSLIINEDDHYGYFSTNRDDTVYDNIYYFVYDKPGDIFVRGTVVDNRDESIVPESKVKLMDVDGNVLKDTLSDQNGAFEFRLSYRRHYKLNAAKLGYKTINTDSIYTAKANDIIEDRILRIEPREVLVSIVAVDKDTRDVISGAAITCLDLAMNTGVNLKPNVNAFEFITNLGKKYEMSGSKAGYFANSIQKTIGYDERSDVLRFEIPLEKIVLDKAIELENIYYDLDKSFIRADAAVELDKLVKILVDNPTIKIELGSHTDSRGSDNYNQRLSQRRATSAVEYIVKNGIDKGRIVAKGYGETALVNKCSNGVQCSKEEHQRNRRTEFKVTSY